MFFSHSQTRWKHNSYEERNKPYYDDFTRYILLGNNDLITMSTRRAIFSLKKKRLALALIELKFVRKSTQVFQIRSQVICIWVQFTAFCNLRELASRLANPFGHPLRWLASTFAFWLGKPSSFPGPFPCERGRSGLTGYTGFTGYCLMKQRFPFAAKGHVNTRNGKSRKK